MAAWRATGADAWEVLTTITWRDLGRPERIPADPPRAALAPRLDNTADIATALRATLGGEEKIYRVAGLPVLVNAGALAAHLDPARSEFLPLIDETLADPFEAWLSFERHRGTGIVRLRSRIVKAFAIAGGRSMLFVANAARGLLEGWTVIPTSDAEYVNRQRRGVLLKGRD